MNKHKLARSLGFHHWNDLVTAATDAKKLREELLAERARHAPLEAQVAQVRADRAALAAERLELAKAWGHLVRLYRSIEQASTETAAACKHLSALYAKHTYGIDTTTETNGKEKQWISD